MNKKIVFNISASSYKVYKDSPLVFYYQYISKEKPDTMVNHVYGAAGNVLHGLLEDYNNKKDFDYEIEFNKRWTDKKLNISTGFNGKPLNKEQYWKCFTYGKKLSDKVYNITSNEEFIELPFVSDDKVSIKLKGYIDFIAEKDGKITIGDWKSNSSKGSFEIAAKMYFLLYWRKHNIFPEKACYEFLKLGSSTIYHFTKEEILTFEEELKEFIENIKEWGFNKRKYEIGNIDSPFNSHKQKCYTEMLKRENTISIECDLENNHLYFNKTLPERLRKIMILKYSYDVLDSVPKYKKDVVLRKHGGWDGRKYFFRNNKLSYAFIHNFIELIKDYNDRFDTNYELKVNDLRDKDVLNKVFKTKFKDTDIKLRYYQIDAVNQALIKEVGILALGCGAGKTIIAADLIKKLNRRTLFLVNRIELAEQTKAELENYLGVEVGLMTEGNLVVNNQIIVASIQTIYAILKRKDKDSELLKTYLYNISVVIADEIQNVKNSGFYKSVYTNTSNLLYCIGLSGSPFRSQGDTLEMNSLVGFPIYWKTTEELTKEGFLCPSKCFFIKLKDENYVDKYQDAYTTYIVENEERNDVIKNIVDKYKNNKKILILTRRIKHAEILNKIIPNSIVITGSTNKKKRKKDYERFKNSDGIVLIGSTKIFSAGVNIPDLDLLINTTAHKSSVDSIQIVGRPKRKSEGKKMGYYIDFADEGKFFKNATNERMSILKVWGEDVSIVDSLDGEIV